MFSGCRGGNGVSRFKRSETESQPASLQQGDVHSYLNVNTPCTHRPGTGFKTALGATIAGIRARLYQTCFESMRDFVTSKAKQTIPAYGCRVAMKTATQITDSTVPAKSKRLLKIGLSRLADSRVPNRLKTTIPNSLLLRHMTNYSPQ